MYVFTLTLAPSHCFGDTANDAKRFKKFKSLLMQLKRFNKLCILCIYADFMCTCVCKLLYLQYNRKQTCMLIQKAHLSPNNNV